MAREFSEKTPAEVARLYVLTEEMGRVFLETPEGREQMVAFAESILPDIDPVASIIGMTAIDYYISYMHETLEEHGLRQTTQFPRKLKAAVVGFAIAYAALQAGDFDIPDSPQEALALLQQRRDEVSFSYTIHPARVTPNRLAQTRNSEEYAPLQSAVRAAGLRLGVLEMPFLEGIAQLTFVRGETNVTDFTQAAARIRRNRPANS